MKRNMNTSGRIPNRNYYKSRLIWKKAEIRIANHNPKRIHGWGTAYKPRGRKWSRYRTSSQLNGDATTKGHGVSPSTYNILRNENLKVKGDIRQANDLKKAVKKIDGLKINVMFNLKVIWTSTKLKFQLCKPHRQQGARNGYKSWRVMLRIYPRELNQPKWRAMAFRVELIPHRMRLLRWAKQRKAND